MSYDFISHGICASLYSSELTHSNPNKFLLLKLTIFKQSAIPDLENRGEKEDVCCHGVQPFLINMDTWVGSVCSVNKYLLPHSPKAILLQSFKLFDMGLSSSLGGVLA